MNKHNLTSILLAVLFSIAFGFISNIYSQDEAVMDSIITGNKYKITLFNDKEVIGKVVKQDSVYAYIVTETGTVRVRFEDIFSVSKNTVPKLLKGMLSLGGGILLNASENYQYQYNNKPGFSFQATGLFPFSENKAIRFDFSYSRMKIDPVVYAYSYNEYSSTYSQRNTDIYSLYGEFVFGNFNTDVNFSLYGLGGAGIIHINESAYSYNYYASWDSTWRTENYPSFNHTNFSLTLGGGMRYNINKRIGIYAEAQYNISTYEGFFFFFGSGYFPIRAGLTYSFY